MIAGRFGHKLSVASRQMSRTQQAALCRILGQLLNLFGAADSFTGEYGGCGAVAALLQVADRSDLLSIDPSLGLGADEKLAIEVVACQSDESPLVEIKRQRVPLVACGDAPGDAIVSAAPQKT